MPVLIIMIIKEGMIEHTTHTGEERKKNGTEKHNNKKRKNEKLQFTRVVVPLTLFVSFCSFLLIFFFWFTFWVAQVVSFITLRYDKMPNLNNNGVTKCKFVAPFKNPSFSHERRTKMKIKRITKHWGKSKRKSTKKQSEKNNQSFF